MAIVELNCRIGSDGYGVSVNFMKYLNAVTLQPHCCLGMCQISEVQSMHFSCVSRILVVAKS